MVCQAASTGGRGSPARASSASSAEDRVHRSVREDLPAAQHQDVVGDLAHQSQVVRDEHDPAALVREPTQCVRAGRGRTPVLAEGRLVGEEHVVPAHRHRREGEPGAADRRTAGTGRGPSSPVRR
ncbi:hypothetical protein [Cellulomonas sp.]|uniref:hypothetical protein n=1 Tax=Cellulomonas sp. TaxID=40001 RepID=UPI003BAC885A